MADPAHQPLDVCCGHDLVEILSFGLRETLGPASTRALDVNPERVGQALRMALSPHGLRRDPPAKGPP